MSIVIGTDTNGILFTFYTTLLIYFFNFTLFYNIDTFIVIELLVCFFLLIL